MARLSSRITEDNFIGISQQLGFKNGGKERGKTLFEFLQKVDILLEKHGLIDYDDVFLTIYKRRGKKHTYRIQLEKGKFYWKLRFKELVEGGYGLNMCYRANIVFYGGRSVEKFGRVSHQTLLEINRTIESIMFFYL